MTRDFSSYLKNHTEALVKDVGVEAACAITGKSKATLGRYYSHHDEHANRYMPIDTVAHLEDAAGYPHVTTALAELAGLHLARSRNDPSARDGHVTSDVALLSRRFGLLMEAYAEAIADNVITTAEARQMLAETMELQKVLVEMKLHLEAATD
ncbi:phage regulatory CII family protein [Jannaschia aquimarina]|uniref:Phage regulatory protein CII (CP76) n=1 Tax=Jannaschia aquimarina TaxID=935700 RepID=A0A0D1CRR0_9RHOB|nr:phage regulatory CII family protein [Jannaschia aquimarina]KIT17487.1 hypothetical protein jaqu_06750 [Jannaschia aquimarina]SNS74783.1 hypothetical protein SAMN05421775_102135 [Jannaschia aquimarina]